MELRQIYFWTATIRKWQRLLERDTFKNVIIDSLNHLSNQGKLDVFAFVIMPNHIHLIWKVNEQNGKETTVGSFLKYTAHEFKKILKATDQSELMKYKVQARNKEYEFWQRDSLAIHLYTPKVIYQKLNYIHANPVAEKWQLTSDPCDYHYSSARFYEKGVVDFPFIKDLRNEL